MVSIALIQETRTADLKANLAQTITAVRAAAKSGAKIICLQELFLGLYFCQSESLEPFAMAETIPGPTTDVMSALAKELQVVLIVPIFEKRMAGVYHNSTVVIDADGSSLGIYRKMHIPDDPLFYEKYYFTPGDLGFKVFKTKYADIGVLICWDQWFPEGARLTALAGAQILFYPTAIGFQEADRAHYATQRDAWLTIQRSHAISNGVYVAAPNRVGREGQLQFWGSSFVADPSGRIIKQASDDKPETVICDCDLASIESVRQNWPYLRDRRVDAYGGLLKHGL